MKGEDEDDDAVKILLQLLDDLLIYRSGSLFETSVCGPSKEDFSGIQSEQTTRILQILRKYVRPRNEVLRIRRTVNTALRQGNVEDGNIFADFLNSKQRLESLKHERAELQEKLRSIRGKPPDSDDMQKVVQGEILLRKLEKQLKILQIFHKHLNLLHTATGQVDKETVLLRTRELSSLLSLVTTDESDSSNPLQSNLETTRDTLRSLQLSNPKYILQSLSFLTSLSTQSLQKRTPSQIPKSDKSSLEASLLPVKQQLIATAERLASLQSLITSLPKKEYATTEGKCRALKAARTEALDRLDEIVSSVDMQQVSQEWDDDVAAAREIIDERVQRIRVLLERYYKVRMEVQELCDEAKEKAKKITSNERISAFQKTEVPKNSEWTKVLGYASISNSPSNTINLTQLEAALEAKWKIENAQRIHANTISQLAEGVEGINEVLYNISLESPLLRDADIFDTKCIPSLWRDASLQRTEKLREWVLQKIRESNNDLHQTQDNLEKIHVLEKEAEALKTLGDNVL